VSRIPTLDGEPPLALVNLEDWKYQDVSTCMQFGLDFAQIPPDQSPCWLPLFDQPTIAVGFPVPMRDGMVGLEMPLDIMATLAGASCAVEFEGGVVIKGFSTILVPKHRSGDTIQWHLVVSEGEDRLTYHEGLEKAGPRIMLDELNLESLHSTRAILGWCSRTETVLGKESVDYESISYPRTTGAAGRSRAAGAALGFREIPTAQVEDFTRTSHWQVPLSKVWPIQENRYMRFKSASGSL
jgi:hypothetical protein